MTPQRAKELLPIVHAIADGKTIQFMPKALYPKEWMDCGPDGFRMDDGYNYRIKPEKKWRPWKPEEAPVGALLRNKGELVRCAILAGRGPSHISSTRGGKPCTVTFLEAFEECEHSLDSGKTWQPCGVEE